MDLPDNAGHSSRGQHAKTQFTQYFPLILFAVAGIVVFSHSAKAAITPHLDLGLYYNDNATLAPSGQEQQAYITELKPGVLLERNGARFDGRLDYTLQALKFSGDVDSTNTYHQLTADSTTDLVSRSLFLDARARYSQQFITPEGTIDLDNLSDIQNRADVLTYSVSPYLRQQYGTTANAEYRIGSQRVEYTNTTNVSELNSTNNTASIMVENGTAFNQLLWRITYSYNNIKYDEQGADSTLQRELLALRYRLTPKFAALGNIGYENNDYEQVVGAEPPSGTIWSAGFAWTPSRRTALEVTAGERYFGSTASLNFSHRTRRTQWSLQYTEEITSTPELQAELTGEVGPTGNPLFNVTQTTSVILLERWQFSFSFDTGKTTITTDLYDNQVEFQTTNEQESTLGATLTWRWRFMPRTTAVLDTTWYETEPRGTNRTDTLTDAGVSIERRLSQSVTGIVGYGKLTRSSDVPTSEYERNLISLIVRAQF